MRYEPFLFDQETEGVEYVHDPNATGLIVIHKDISDAERSNNIRQVEVMYAIHATISELLQLPNLQLETTAHWHSFFLVEGRQGDREWGLNSPKLSRNKLALGSPHQIAVAVVDLIVSRDQWNDRNAYNRLRL